MSIVACVIRKEGIEPIVDTNWCLVIKSNKKEMLQYLDKIGEVKNITETMYHLTPFIRKIGEDGTLTIGLFGLDMLKV
jgi:hypothetical protein